MATFFSRVTITLHQRLFYVQGSFIGVRCEIAEVVATPVTGVVVFLGLVCTLAVVGAKSVTSSSLGNSRKEPETNAGASPVAFSS